MGTKDADWWVSHASVDFSSSVVGIESLIDGSQNAVWPLALGDEFRRIMKNAITCL